MQGLDLLLIGLLYLSICGTNSVQVSGDEALDFVDTKEQQVRFIGSQARLNYVNKCELVRTCQSNNCSRRECYPLRDEKLECVYVTNNSLCRDGTGFPCNNVRADLQRGYVRLPPLDLTFGNTVEQIMGDTVCTQRELDAEFIRLNENIKQPNSSSNSYFFNLYFGSVDGSFRYYPGREQSECDSYDPRIRPWYTGAISLVKDLVVLIDTGTYMGIQIGVLNFSTRLHLATSMARQLMRTLTSFDRATIIPVNDSADPILTRPPEFVVPDDGLNLLQREFLSFLDKLDSESFLEDSSSQRTSNFTTGFRQALSIFNDSRSPANSLKIVVLITTADGQYQPSGQDVETASQFSKQGPRLLVYELGESSTSNWGSLACEVGGVNENLELTMTLANPLTSLKSYFSFLARSHITANQGSQESPVFWHSKYVDASGLGDVITVAYPTMSDDGLELIGVAGIDVQVAGLDSSLEGAIEKLLQDRVRQAISVYPSGVDIPESHCDLGYSGNVSESECGNVDNVFCQQDIKASFESLTCCGTCVQGSGDGSKIAVWISVSVLGAVLLALTVLISYLLRRCQKSKVKQVAKRLLMHVYSYEELRQATNDFAADNIIGKGAFGVVYRAILRHGTVAVKRMKQPADRADDFQRELKILGITSHSNLVELKGTCFQPTECFLVYDLVEGGDLHSWLWPEENHDYDAGNDSAPLLTWSQRWRIARGTARGLNYLHQGLLPNGRIFHLDIKPRNILLEEDFTPKIADFGISQLYEPGYTMRVVSVKAGTLGYIAPEVLQGQCTPNSKLDVYSYGMVLLQLVSGRKLTDPLARPYLLQWARDQVEDGHALRVVDKRLIEAVKEEYRGALMDNCRVVINLALRCLLEDPDLRPEMSYVLDRLDGLLPVVDLETPGSSDIEEERSNSLEKFPENINLMPLNLDSSGLLNPGRTVQLSAIVNDESKSLRLEDLNQGKSLSNRLPSANREKPHYSRSSSRTLTRGL